MATEPDTEAVTYRPVGEVRSPFETPSEVPVDPDDPPEARGAVDLDPAYADGLRRLDGFSHVLLVAHLHETADRTSLTASPPFAADVTPGVFATRSPVRPNGVAVSVVRLLGVEDARLRVSGLDLLDGTPVLDLKPHVPDPDRAAAVERGWLDRLDGG